MGVVCHNQSVIDASSFIQKKPNIKREHGGGCMLFVFTFQKN